MLANIYIDSSFAKTFISAVIIYASWTRGAFVAFVTVEKIVAEFGTISASSAAFEFVRSVPFKATSAWLGPSDLMLFAAFLGASLLLFFAGRL